MKVECFLRMLGNGRGSKVRVLIKVERFRSNSWHVDMIVAVIHEVFSGHINHFGFLMDFSFTDDKQSWRDEFISAMSKIDTCDKRKNGKIGPAWTYVQYIENFVSGWMWLDESIVYPKRKSWNLLSEVLSRRYFVRKFITVLSKNFGRWNSWSKGATICLSRYFGNIWPN